MATEEDIVVSKTKSIHPSNSGFPAVRLRRLRQSPAMRDLIAETQLSVNDLVLPLFIKEGKGIQKAIGSMPGHYQWSPDLLDNEIKAIAALKIPAVVLFGIPAHKDPHGESGYRHHNVITEAVKRIKDLAPNMLVITDACFCGYTDHGHCGVIKPGHGDFEVDNDATLERLQRMALCHARAGADIIAPSGMMDGAIQAMRHALDDDGFQRVSLLSYAVKYASSFYGGFRDAAESGMQFGDRQGYQMDQRNANEALREVSLDVQEGADMLMVKPAHTYLDIIYRIKQNNPQLPLAAYHVSGEYAQIKLVAEQGLVDERAAAIEVTTAIKRAGADFILSYYSKDIANWLGG